MGSLNGHFSPPRDTTCHYLQILLIYVLDSLFELSMEVTELSTEKACGIKTKGGKWLFKEKASNNVLINYYSQFD